MKEPDIYLSGGGNGDYMNRVKRVLYLDQRFRDGTCPSLRELAVTFGVSDKTVRRDIESMKIDLGAPIEFDRGRNGYRYEDSSFCIPAISMSERDLFALMVAENAIEQYSNTPLGGYLRAAFEKILASMPRSVRSAHAGVSRAIYFGGMQPCRSDPETWSTLVLCIEQERRVAIDYFLPSEGEARRREVEPYILVVRDRDWFLVAKTVRSRRIATFYLPRIRVAEALDDWFEKDSDFDPLEFGANGFNALSNEGAKQRVELRFPSEYSFLADEREWSEGQELEAAEDGSVRLTFETTVLFEVARHVLRYCGRVVVIAPESLRLEVRSYAEKVLELHSD